MARTLRAIDQTYSSAFRLLVHGPLPLRDKSLGDEAEDARIEQIRRRLAAGELALFDDPSLFRRHPQFARDIDAPSDWRSPWALVLRAQLAPNEDFWAAEVFAPNSTGDERLRTRRWVVWRCADDGLVRVCDPRISDVAWFDEYFIELDEGLSDETSYTLHVLRTPVFEAVDPVRFELAPDNPALARELVATSLIALGHPGFIAVLCDEHGQQACFDIIDLRAHPPRRRFTTPLMTSLPVGSRDGRWLCYPDGVRVALVDLIATPPTVSRHRVVVPAGVQMWWTDLKIAWDASSRLSVRCPENTNAGRFDWAGTFELPLAKDLALERAPVET